MITIYIYFFKNFYCYSVTVVCLSPHPSTPPQLNPPPSPTSTLPLGFVHVSFIVVPIPFIFFKKHSLTTDNCNFLSWQINFIVLIVYFCIFSITIYPLIPSSTSAHTPPIITTLLSMSMSPFSFLLDPTRPQTPTLPELSACSLSMSLSLFCLLVQFVHYIPYMSEIMWYLSFSDWLMSLSIMFSRSVYAVTKGKIFLFIAKWYSIV